MSKTVAYFPLQCALNSKPVIAAVLDSLSNHGFDIDIGSYDADIAVIWSVLWSGRMELNRQVYEHYRKHNKPVVCIDVGALHRGVTWKIALNNINAQGYYGHQQDLDWDRPKKLKLALKTKNDHHDRILIAGQHNKSLQLEGIDQESWYVEKINEIRKYSDPQIVVRPHPRCKLDRSKFPQDVVWQEPSKLTDTYDSFDISYEYDSVVNYNSGPGIQAAIAGTAPIVDKTSLAYPVSATIGQPWHTYLERWFVEICHTEYTLKEIEQGLWITRLALT